MFRMLLAGLRGSTAAAGAAATAVPGPLPAYDVRFGGVFVLSLTRFVGQVVPASSAGPLLGHLPRTPRDCCTRGAASSRLLSFSPCCSEGPASDKRRFLVSCRSPPSPHVLPILLRKKYERVAGGFAVAGEAEDAVVAAAPPPSPSLPRGSGGS